jgi:hypothetical protein
VKSARLLALGIVGAVAAFPSCSAPPPEQAAPRPDLNGTWGRAVVFGLDFVRPETLPDGSVCVGGCAAQQEDAGTADDPPAPDFPVYKPEFLAKVGGLAERQVDVDTVLRCYPPGVPRIGPPAKIVQTATEVVFLYDDYNGSFFRVIPTDGRPHRQGLPPGYLGDAVGSFEGDTLVVETVNFTDETWLTDSGAFHTKDLRVVERLRREGDTLQYQAVAHDPAVLVEPWVMRPRELSRSTVELEETPRCDERDLEHMVDGSYHENPR